MHGKTTVVILCHMTTPTSRVSVHFLSCYEWLASSKMKRLTKQHDIHIMVMYFMVILLLIP